MGGLNLIYSQKIRFTCYQSWFLNGFALCWKIIAKLKYVRNQRGKWAC
jgi:hypothetical protein